MEKYFCPPFPKWKEKGEIREKIVIELAFRVHFSIVGIADERKF